MQTQTREQRLAADVYRLISQVPADSTYKNAYGGMAHKLPVLIRTAGLVQALEFVAARSKDQRAQKDLLGDLATVLEFNSADELRQASREAPLSAYMRLTQEALQALLWFKRYAQSVLGVEGGGDEQPAQ
jgi:CRISPR-associated protein Cmr5